jgi:serine phosphatase RsbU (regulator of sigma subunit)
MMLITIGVLGFLLIIAILFIIFVGDFKKAGEIYVQNKPAYKISDVSNTSLSFDDEQLKDELKRQGILIEELNRRIQENTSKTVSHKKESASDLSKEMIDLARQTQILEQEKVLFIEKNKKLWEQSVAIHKEKERIDSIKSEIEARHKEIVDSINYAQTIQKAIVTGKKYLDTLLTDYFILWLPKNVVSGDFYWAKETPKGLMLIVADCTGHGVPGAFMSLLGISFLNQIVSQNSNIEPAELLEEMRKNVKSALHQNDNSFTNKDGMDMSCVLIDYQTKKIVFAGANNPGWIFHEQEMIELDAVKNPIGVFRREKPFEQAEYQYTKNDILYLFSDGYADQFGGKQNTKLKRQSFKTFLLEVSSQKLKMSSIQELAHEFFLMWKGKNKQTDDVILMGIRL